MKSLKKILFEIDAKKLILNYSELFLQKIFKFKFRLKKLNYLHYFINNERIITLNYEFRNNKLLTNILSFLNIEIGCKKY